MTETAASAGSVVQSRALTGYDRLDAMLQGGFLTGSAVLLCTSPSDEALHLLRGFLGASELNERSLLIARSASVRDALQVNPNHATFLVCGERVQSSDNILAGKALENLTELSLDISEALGRIQPNRVVIDITSDLLLRHGPLQTRKWLSDQLSRLKRKGITTLALLNPSMHSQADVSAVADLFDGNIEIIEKEMNGQPKKLLRVKWMHGITVTEKEWISLDLSEPSRSAKTVPRNNLPAKTTPVIGREKELSDAWPLLLRDEVRILTLTGPAGTGKTTLGLEVARNVLDTFPDGVFFVRLAPICDPDLVVPTIAATLGLKDEGSVSLIDRLRDYLREKRSLLVLDNFEQVVTAAPQVADIASACQMIKMLVTSREALRISGEREFPVPSLALPDLKHLPSLEVLLECGAVSLFVDRAHAAKPDFDLTEENARAVAEICVRLDGLPLALGLAAARIKVLSPQTMLRRLESRLGLLTVGGRDLPARQQTLRNAIAWSHDLLNDDEKKLFRRLSVFVGGFTLEAAEAVCNVMHDLNLGMVDGLSGLINRNLLRPEDAGEEPRFGYLETIREFASECLASSAESEAMQRGHANFFMNFAEKAEPELSGPNQARWLTRLDEEHDNLRASLDWCIQSKENEMSLRLAGALARFWYFHGHWSEGSKSLDVALKNSPSEPTEIRAKVLCSTRFFDVSRGRVEEGLAIYRRFGNKDGVARALNNLAIDAFQEGDLARSTEYYAEALSLFRELNNKERIATILPNLEGIELLQGKYEKAISGLEESLAIGREIGNKQAIAYSLVALAYARMIAGDKNYGELHSLLEESLIIARELGDKCQLLDSLNNLGDLEGVQGQHEKAANLHKERLRLSIELDSEREIAASYGALGYDALRLGNFTEAKDHFSKSIIMSQRAGTKRVVSWCLRGVAWLSAAEGLAERAARLFGAAGAIDEAMGQVLVDPFERVEHERYVELARTQLGGEAWVGAYTEGRAMTLEQAVACALTKEPEKIA